MYYLNPDNIPAIIEIITISITQIHPLGLYETPHLEQTPSLHDSLSSFIVWKEIHFQQNPFFILFSYFLKVRVFGMVSR